MAHVQKVRHILAGLAFLDQLATLVDLVRREPLSVSPCSSFFRQRRRAGCFVVAPDKPSPLKTVWHLAFFSAASCEAGFWWSRFILTRQMTSVI